MSTVLRRNRKGSDEQIIRLNAIGLSLATIAQTINCHPTSITLRLKSLHIPAADTRRTFMEDIYSALPEAFKSDLADILMESEKPLSVKTYVRDLLTRDVAARMSLKIPANTNTEVTIEADNPVVTDIVVPQIGFHAQSVG